MESGRERLTFKQTWLAFGPTAEEMLASAKCTREELVHKAGAERKSWTWSSVSPSISK